MHLSAQVVVDVFFRIQYFRHVLLGRFSNVAFVEITSYEAAIVRAQSTVVRDAHCRHTCQIKHRRLHVHTSSSARACVCRVRVVCVYVC